MANLVISNRCNMQCAYCFSRDFLNGSAPDNRRTFISEADLSVRLDFLERSGIEDVRLIGGEPGLHPRFGNLIRQAERRFPKIVVFTNGVLPEGVLSALVALPPERLTVMVNMSAGSASGKLSKADQAARERALRLLGGASSWRSRWWGSMARWTTCCL
jgi:molybdenum cofactor biosynthesis enzyme MoaA